MSDALIMEALARVEHKVDLVMHKLGITMTAPMSFIGVHRCPVCGLATEYRIDFQHNVVKRVCGCTTGKQPITLDLTPVTQQKNEGVKNDGQPPDAEPDRAPRAEHGRRR